MNDDSSTRTSASRCQNCGTMHPLGDSCPATEGTRSGMVLDGKYALTRMLGQGGMGEVYEARHTKIGRRVAVKFLHGQFAKRPEVSRRFENEARAAGEVEHENIAGVYDVGVLPDGTQYLVMEFLDGEDLDRVLRREHRLPFPRAVDLVLQACRGLAVVHPRGIVHRDLKPANLFLTRRANGGDLIKILDFGIAKLRRPEGDSSATETGVALGTAYYMSPEQARGERDIGARSDVYALGVILYELLSGRRPHDGTSLLQILHQILTQPPTPLEEACPGLPPGLYQIVRRAMAANAADRFAGVNELAEALTQFMGGTYQPVQYAEPPMLATRIETGAGGVRIGTEHLAASGSGLISGAAHSVPGLANSTATSPGWRWRGLAIAIGAVALLLLGVEGAIKFQHDKAAAAAASASASLPPPPSVTVPPPPPVTAQTAVPASAQSAGGSASEAADKDSANKPVVPPPVQEPVAAHGDDAPGSDHHKGHAPSGGSGNHAGAATAHGGTPHAGNAPNGGAATAATGNPAGAGTPASTGASKPDCTQTYTIDSEGNKHFRPECFQTK